MVATLTKVDLGWVLTGDPATRFWQGIDGLLNDPRWRKENMRDPELPWPEALSRDIAEVEQLMRSVFPARPAGVIDYHDSRVKAETGQGHPDSDEEEVKHEHRRDTGSGYKDAPRSQRKKGKQTLGREYFPSVYSEPLSEDEQPILSATKPTATTTTTTTAQYLKSITSASVDLTSALAAVQAAHEKHNRETRNLVRKLDAELEQHKQTIVELSEDLRQSKLREANLQRRFSHLEQTAPTGNNTVALEALEQMLAR
jgi:hypothetical protein